MSKGKLKFELGETGQSMMVDLALVVFVIALACVVFGVIL